jgi:hypothetical protein
MGGGVSRPACVSAACWSPATGVFDVLFAATEASVDDDGGVSPECLSSTSWYPVIPVVGIIADAGSMNKRFTLGGQHYEFGAVVADRAVTEPGPRRPQSRVPT